MNIRRVNQGISDYLEAGLEAAGYVVAKPDVSDPTINVTPAVTDRKIAPSIPYVVVLLENAPVVVGSMRHGNLRIQIQDNGAGGELADYYDLGDEVSDLFPGQHRDSYGPAVVALATAIEAATGGRATCNGYAIVEGEDVEDQKKWLDDIVLRLGLLEVEP